MAYDRSREQARKTAHHESVSGTLPSDRGESVWRWPSLESIKSDVSYTFRQLSKSPGFAVTVTLTIALGIGANTAIFTLIHAILFKSLPVADPKSLYRIGDKDDCCLTPGFQNDDGDFDLFSYDLYLHLRASTPEFEQLAAMQAGHNRISVRRESGVAQSEPSEFVSGNYFNTFGVRSFAGRALTDADDRIGAAPVAVMSYSVWRSDYASDPSVIGATFYLQSQPVTIVGIASPAFFGDRISTDPPAFWIPLCDEPLLTQANSTLRQVDENWLYLLGRVRPGAEIRPLQQKISTLLRQWILTQSAYTREGIPPILPKVHVVLTPGGAGIQNMQQQTRKKLYLLLTLSGFVLLVACANVANLLLARGTRRRTDVSIRIAIGAARSRLIQQMLTESVVLACLGGAAGVALAYAGARMILALAFPDATHSAIQATPSLPVLGFAFLLSLITGVTFGIVPAWITSYGDPAEALKGVNRSAGDRTSLPQRVLIVFQAALSLALLAGAGLLIRSLNNLEHQNFGLQTTDRYVLHLNPQDAGYNPEQLDALNRSIEQQFAAIPGIESTGLALFSPLDGNQWSFDVSILGRRRPGPNDDLGSLLNRVSPEFFKAVGQQIIRGRVFTQNDTDTSPAVAVVNQAFAKKFFPKEDPVGRRFGNYGLEDIGAYEIVGVVADAKYSHPREDAEPIFFRPLSQWQGNFKNPTLVSIEAQTHYISSIVMSFHGEPQNLNATVRRILADINPKLAVIDLRSLDSQLQGNFNQERLVARLTALFGILTLVLAAVGLYGITSYQVTQRTSEIGLRMAFGANRNRMVGLVMRDALIQVALGLTLGIPIVWIGARYLASQLFLVKPYDPLSLLAAICVLSGTAVIASLIPALRAATIDPMRALRNE